MFIELRMPEICCECGYQCCRQLSEHYKCGRSIWSNDYCTKDCVPIAGSYPLIYEESEEKFVLSACFGFRKGLMPFELVRIVKLLNELRPVNFTYQGRNFELIISSEPPEKRIIIEGPEKGLLKILNWGPEKTLANKLNVY